MVRGLIGLAGIVGLCVALYASTGDAQILWPALGLTGLAAFALAMPSKEKREYGP